MTSPLNAHQLDQIAGIVLNWAAVFLPHLLAALGIFIAGLLISNWIVRAVYRVLAGALHLDPALKPILVAIVRYALLAFTIILTLEQLGFQTSSLLAVLGAAGLAIGLALQGTLSNIAAGIMLLWLRPFQIGDYIEVASQGGAVEEIGLFGCKLRTFDGLFLFLPNSAIWNAPLKNHTRNGGRLVSIDVTLPTAADIGRARTLLCDLAKREEQVLADPGPRVFVEGLSGNGLVVSLVLWTKPQGAGDVERNVIEAIKQALDGADETLKPVLIARAVPADTDPSRFLTGHEPVPLRMR